MAENYTYIVKCRDGTLYNAGTGAKYTRSRRPVVLVYQERFATKEEAMRREWAIKQLTRAQKLRLIAEHPTKKTPCGTP